MICPHCKKSISTADVASNLRARVKNNARPAKLARKAARERWRRYRAKKLETSKAASASKA
jgi:DNA polymerase IIIc chi subunit